ncbi:hypothetical protein [Kitasatospora cineracea]|uniref:Uncharacterized protein n=1 Tax=Kitasatospora cineracea TaxID=88074 RepID=A0A8G1UEK4_9ACTN|nr:hypothetical protein [Kitasatospora cineracea]ROR35816.1 hypothetical protein EDD39_7480 [Kitasatospora cineracea]
MVVGDSGGGGEVRTAVVAPGAFLDNAKSRRAKLKPEQLAALAEHEVERA